MKYLIFDQAQTHLKLGKTIEQWIGAEEKDDYVILKWVTISREKDNLYIVGYTECFDEGNEDFIDIYAFSAVDPDEPFGIFNQFSSALEAIEFSLNKYGLSKDRFLNSGMIQEEYLSYLKS